MLVLAVEDSENYGNSARNRAFGLQEVSAAYRYLRALKRPLFRADLPADNPVLEGRHVMRRLIAAIAALTALVLGGGAGWTGW
jgi:hypothetical protein